MSLPTVTFAKCVEALLYRTGQESESAPSADYNDAKALLNMRLRECWNYTQWDFLKVLTHEDTRADAYVVQGAGTDAVNGYYERNGETSTRPRYSKYDTDGTTVLYDIESITGSSGIAWAIQTAGGSNLYTSDNNGTPNPTPPITDWQVVDGDNPAPTVSRSTYQSIDISDGKIISGLWDQNPRESEHPQMLRASTFVGGELRIETAAPDWVWYEYIPPAPDWVADDPVPTVYEVFRHPAVELAAADIMRQMGKLEAAGAAEGRGRRLLDELCRQYAVMNTQPRMHVRRSIPRHGYWPH